MYAIIRAGGKQAKVHEGDVLDVERVRAEGPLSYTPLLVVADDGAVVSDRDTLSGLTVTADVLGEDRGPKVDVFKYKAKTGYRRRQGHRQTYTRIQITKIEFPAPTKKAAAKKAKAEPEKAKADSEKSEADTAEISDEET